jgi:hypothetical protein
MKVSCQLDVWKFLEDLRFFIINWVRSFKNLMNQFEEHLKKAINLKKVCE